MLRGTGYYLDFISRAKVDTDEVCRYISWDLVRDIVNSKPYFKYLLRSNMAYR